MAPKVPTTVVFVPGAWHNPLAFSIVAYQMKQAGYDTSYVNLASVGPPEHLKEWSPDVQRVREQLKKAIDKGHEVILCVHSYGSLPANDAVEGLDLASRQKEGLRGGVSHIFFCCAFVIPEGKSLVSAFGGQDSPWFDISEDRTQVVPNTPAKTFYNDMPEDEVQACILALKPQSYQCFHTPLSYAAWKHVPSTYLYCLRDEAIPIAVQKLMVEDWGKEANIKTETIDTSHSPFFSKPDAVSSAIRRAAGENL